jgi:hypothetical protein
MSIHQSFGKLLGIALGLLLLAPSLDVHAKPGTGKKAPAAAAALSAKLSISPRSLHWGMSPKEVIKIYDKLIDKDYLPQYQKAQPGVQMSQLENEVAETKRQFAQSLVEFGELPTRLDGTPFAGEFTYRNGESMLEIKRRGRHRHLFFINNRLWKIVDVYKLGDKSRYGADFKTAAAKLDKKLAVAGRATAANANAGQKEEKDWSDGSIHLRAVAWDKGKLALVYEDEGTLAKLATLRTNKPAEQKPGDDIDPDTKAALR